ncbi:MAG: PKD domain-containing protein, partial [Bacteroidetes bacterium]|nr:PKD domain-containing protein [Bacteroidota bacterium]
LHLTAVYSGTINHEWFWAIDNHFDQNDPVNLPTKDSLFTITGLHKAALYVKTYGRCYDSVVKDSIVDAHPVAGFTASPIIGCTPLSVNFKDTTQYTIGTERDHVFWDFGNGDTATVSTQNTNELYPVAGIFNIKQVVTDWIGCKDSVLLTNYIEARKPSAYFVVKKLNGCIGETFNFTNLSVGATRNLATYWSFGDGDSASSFNANHAYSDTGKFVVKMVVMDSTGCRDTMQKTISITKPHAGFTLSDTIAICPPLIVNFHSTSTGGSNYHWDFKNTGTSSFVNPSSTFATPGVYPVTLIVTDGNGCTDTAINSVRVLGYSGAFSYPGNIGCVPFTVSFVSKVNSVDSIIWDFADGYIDKSNGLTISHTYQTPGAYIPKLSFIDKKSGCMSASVGLDTIKIDAVIAGFKASTPCEQSATQLVDTSFSFFSAMKDWRWDFGSSGSAIGNPVTKNYPAAGKYFVTLKATNATGCKDSITQEITIYPLPIVRAMDDTAICIPDGINLLATGAKNYSWTPVNFLSCTNCNYPIAAPNIPTTFKVVGTDSNGCKNTDTLHIGIQTKTTFVINPKMEICLGDSIRLFAAGATVYSWTPFDGLDSPNIAQPLASPKTNTIYVVTAKEGSCAASDQKVTVSVHPLPIVDAGGDLKIVAGKSALLQASGFGISHVKWDADSTLSCLDCFAPEAKPKLTTTYKITAYNEFGCTSTDSVTVVVLCDGSQLFIPNTFSPNGDGNNDVFFPRGEGIQLIRSFRIYNRWGELMFARENVPVNDASAGWDGLHNGKILSPDVFVYILEANCSSGAPIVFKGDITLLK